jgi:hypothetical protein
VQVGGQRLRLPNRIGLALRSTTAPARVTSTGSKTKQASTMPSSGGSTTTSAPSALSSSASRSCWATSSFGSGCRQPAAAKSPTVVGVRSATPCSGAVIDRTP